MEFTDGKVTPKQVLDRVKNTAVFVRSVLHLPFPDLEGINPSFGLMSKYCDLLATLLKEDKEQSGSAHSASAEQLARILAEVAEAIIDRNDSIIIDCMAEIDEFLHQTTTALRAVE